MAGEGLLTADGTEEAQSNAESFNTVRGPLRALIVPCGKEALRWLRNLPPSPVIILLALPGILS
jgi:hypothetical protein